MPYPFTYPTSMGDRLHIDVTNIAYKIFLKVPLDLNPNEFM
jgi:hypothetical protein